MSYGNGIKLTAGFDVGAKTPLDSKSVVQTIAERDAFVTDNLVYEGLEVYVKDTGHKYRYNGTSWIDLDTQSGSESGTGEGLTIEQANQLTTAYEHSQTPHVSADDIPTNISDLTNDSGFITSIPSEYITETELEAKGYLTEHQSLTDYAKKTDIPDVSDFLTEVPAGYVTDTKLSTELDKKVNKEAGKGLSTNDLTNELVIKINSSATEAFVTNAIANAQLGSGEVDLSGYATIDALKLKADLTHTHDQYLTKVPDEYITETELNAKGYLTSHQDISGLQPKTDDSLTTTDKTVVGAINELKTNMSNINTGGGSSFSGSYNDLTDKPTIPTKTSDLNNDSSFIGYPDVIVIDKGDMYTELDLDNDIPLGNNIILLTGSVVYHAYEHELVSVYRDVDSPDGFTIYTVRGNRVSVSKSNGNWSITSSTSFIYSDSAKVLYQKINDNTLTTTAKTIPTAINELKSGLDDKVDKVEGSSLVADTEIAKIHEHANQDVLDNLTKDADSGKLLFEGNPISTEVNIATVDEVGTVKPDGTTIIIDEDGIITAVGGGEGGASTADAVEYVNDAISVTNVEDALNKLISDYYYVAPSVTAFTASPSGGTFEVGTTITAPITFNWNYNKDITTQTLTDCTLADETVRTATYDSDISSNKTFTLQANDGKNNVSKSISYTFVNPYYVGVSATDTLIETDIIALTKKVEVKGNKTINYTTSQSHMVFAYPSSYDVIKSVIDQNGFNVTDSFAQNTVTVNGVNYYVYVSNKCSGIYTISYRY